MVHENMVSNLESFHAVYHGAIYRHYDLNAACETKYHNKFEIAII